MRNLRSIIVELQQRRVFRIASVYVVSMWIVVQGAVDLFPVFGVPDWAARLLVVVAILGLPVAVVLAWAFQLTPSGVIRDTGSGDDAASSGAKMRLDLVVVAAFEMYPLGWLPPEPVMVPGLVVDRVVPPAT